MGSLRAFAMALVMFSAAILGTQARPAMELSTNADGKSNIDVGTLTCAQFANTNQEDADMVVVW